LCFAEDRCRQLLWASFEANFLLIDKIENIKKDGMDLDDILVDRKIPKGAVKIYKGDSVVEHFITKVFP
jgi:hypothetical protein